MANQATLGTGRVTTAARRTQKSSESVSSHGASVQPTEDAIRQRAYEIFLSRAPGSGSAMDDWLQAERELRSQAAHRRPPVRIG